MSEHLFHLGVAAPEKVVRTVAVYAAIAVLLRLAGKRDLAQLNTFDLVVMLLLSNVVQNAIIGPDDSLVGGLLGAAVLIAVNSLVVRVVASNERLTRLFEGTPTVLVEDGNYDRAALRREGLRREDLDVALRRQGANSVDDVAEATLAPGGAVVITLKDGEQPASRADVLRIEAKLDALLAQRG